MKKTPKNENLQGTTLNQGSGDAVVIIEVKGRENKSPQSATQPKPPTETTTTIPIPIPEPKTPPKPKKRKKRPDIGILKPERPKIPSTESEESEPEVSVLEPKNPGPELGTEPEPGVSVRGPESEPGLDVMQPPVLSPPGGETGVHVFEPEIDPQISGFWKPAKYLSSLNKNQETRVGIQPFHRDLNFQEKFNLKWSSSSLSLFDRVIYFIVPLGLVLSFILKKTGKK